MPKFVGVSGIINSICLLKEITETRSQKIRKELLGQLSDQIEEAGKLEDYIFEQFHDQEGNFEAGALEVTEEDGKTILTKQAKAAKEPMKEEPKKPDQRNEAKRDPAKPEEAGISYIKTTFPTTYEPKSENLKEVLGVFKMSEDADKQLPGLSGYKERYKIAEGVTIDTKGEYTKNAQGQETTQINVQASACEALEKAGVMHKLIEAITKNSGRCARLDYYAKYSQNEQTPEQVIAKAGVKSKPHEIIKSPTTITIVWGRHDDTEIVMTSEEPTSGKEKTPTNWTRAEKRYYHQQAANEFKRLSKSFEKGTQNKRIAAVFAQEAEEKKTEAMTKRAKAGKAPEDEAKAEAAKQEEYAKAAEAYKKQKRDEKR